MLRYNGRDKTVATTAQSPTRGSSLLMRVSQRFTAVNKKSECRFDTSCQRSTHSPGGKTPNEAKPPTPPDSPLGQTHHPGGSSNLTHFLSASSRQSDEGSERMTGVSAAPWSESVSRGSWTDQAYLSMALCAWADPACRSFCHCRNFFSLSRGERREGNVSVKPKQDSKGARVRPMCVLEIQIPPGLNL